MGNVVKPRAEQPAGELGDYYRSYGGTDDAPTRELRYDDETAVYEDGYDDDGTVVYEDGYDDGTVVYEDASGDDYYDDGYYEEYDDYEPYDPAYDQGAGPDGAGDRVPDPWPEVLKARANDAMTGLDTSLARLDRLLGVVDRLPARWMADHWSIVARLGLGLVFLWGGVLKLVPDLSPTEPLVRATATDLFDATRLPISPSLALYVLSALEIVIGLGLILDLQRRAFVWLLIVHLVLTILPVALLPEWIWERPPLGLTLEGEYVIRNLVLLGAAMAVGASATRQREPMVPVGPESPPDADHASES